MRLNVFLSSKCSTTCHYCPELDRRSPEARVDLPAVRDALDWFARQKRAERPDVAFFGIELDVHARALTRILDGFARTPDARRPNFSATIEDVRLPLGPFSALLERDVELVLDWKNPRLLEDPALPALLARARLRRKEIGLHLSVGPEDLGDLVDRFRRAERAGFRTVATSLNMGVVWTPARLRALERRLADLAEHCWRAPVLWLPLVGRGGDEELRLEDCLPALGRDGAFYASPAAALLPSSEALALKTGNAATGIDWALMEALAVASWRETVDRLPAALARDFPALMRSVPGLACAAHTALFRKRPDAGRRIENLLRAARIVRRAGALYYREHPSLHEHISH